MKMSQRLSQSQNEATCRKVRRKITFSTKELEKCVVCVDGKYEWFRKRGSKGKQGGGMKIYTDLMLPKVRQSVK